MVDTLIHLYNLRPLEPEGGLFAQTYASEHSTAIFYLLSGGAVSALHRLHADEIYHFYLGSPVEMLLLHPDGTGETRVLGQDVLSGHLLQTVVPAGCWQGSRLQNPDSWALMGTTMSPGFDASRYEPGDRAAMCETYPTFTEQIKQLTSWGVAPTPN